MQRARKLAPARLIAATATAAVATGVLVAAAPAGAASLASPQNVTLRGIGTSSITVAAAHSSGATSYRLYASTVRADLYAYNISSWRSTRHVAASSSPTVTVGGLPSTASPYYYRYATVNGSSVRLSEAIGTTYVRPPSPSNFAAASTGTGYWLSWTGLPVTGYEVWMSTDPTLRTGVRVWKVMAPANEFTPYGLIPHTTYYFMMRAMNGALGSTFTYRRVITPSVSGQLVRLASYNIQVRNFDGQMEGGERIGMWDTQRRPAAAALLRNAGAEVVAVQEGGNVLVPRGPRQVDTLAATLGSNWTVAMTEPRTDPGYILTGNYIMYRNDLFTAVGNGGHWASQGQQVAAYQLLRRNVTGATFLVVSMHLNVSGGTTGDNIRMAQMRQIISNARGYAAYHGIRAIVYAGDTNSLYARWHLSDGPGTAAYTSYLQSAWHTAPFKYDTQYNSFNGNQRQAPTGLGSIDRVFGEPGVSMMSWSLLMNLDRYGRFIGTIPSDHNALMTSVVIPYPR